jgi:hypothetical protein
MLTEKLTPEAIEDLQKLRAGIESLQSFVFRWNSLATQYQESLGLGLFPEVFLDLRKHEIEEVLKAYEVEPERMAA